MIWMKVRRVLLRAILALVAVLVLVWASMPVWFPWVIGPVLHRYGVRYEAYERMGYRRLEIHHVQLQTGGGQLTADRVETVLPTVWLWRHYFGYKGAAPLVIAENWQVNLTTDLPNAGAARPRTAPSRVDSVTDILDEIDSRLPRVRAWLSSARLIDGGVVLHAETIKVGLIEWDGRLVRVRAASETLGQTVDAELDLGAAVDWRFTAKAEPAGATVQTRIFRDGSIWKIDGDIMWQGNRAAFASTFASGRWLPAEASLAAASLRVPARLLKLEPYGDMTGSLHLTWSDDQFRLKASAYADPLDSAFPPVKLNIAASGDAKAAIVETLDVNSPWLQAELSDTFRLERAAQRWVTTPALLRLHCDLERLPVVRVRGRLTGTARIEPSTQRYPRVVVSVTGEGLSAYDTEIQTGRLEAAVEWPLVKILSAEVSLADHMAVTATGTVDVVSQRVLDGTVCMSRNGAAIQATGSAQLGTGPVVRLDRLVYQMDGREVYHLAVPSQVSLGPGGSVSLDGLHLEGDGRALSLAGSVAWPQRGRLQVNGWGVRLQDLEGWIGKPVPDITLDGVALEGSWDNGPMRLTAMAQGQWSREDGRPVSVHVEASADETGLSLQRVSFMGDESEAVMLHGHIPVAIVPTRWPRPWQELTGSPLQVEAVVKPDPSVTQRLFEQIGVRVKEPDLRLTISGSLAEPQGRIEAGAQRIELGPLIHRSDIPALDNVHMEVEIDRQCVTMRALTMQVEGQAVQATGECPVPPGYWAGLLSAPALPDWRTATGRLTLDRARIEAFKQAKGVLLPLGSVSMDVSLQPGGRLDGQLSIADASIRPLGSLAAIRDIQAQVHMEGRSARIGGWTAQVGGQPVTVTGWARWTDVNHPEFELTLKGQNVPLIRQAGLILRSDVDLQVAQTREQPAQVTGQVVLRDSLYLRDLRLLVPSASGQARDRPPYFSVEEGPLADWRLALRVRGDRFLQVRTPWFSGEVSADFRLQGIMREPVAVGEARVNSGMVRFPFADFTVDRGLVELAPANPYQPTLDLMATCRSYGYTLRLSVTGPAEQPVLVFSSTPAMTSEGILLLVTAGELPKGSSTTLTAQQRASQVAGFFARDLLRRVSTDDGAGDRLSIRSGEDLSVTGQPTRTVEYELDDKWSVYGESDRFNQLNAGLKWRLYSK